MDFSKPYSSFSVNDIEAARKFYTEVLGLEAETIKPNFCPEMLSLKLTNDTQVLVYPKENHVPATFTILNFPVADIEKAVKKFSSKGITFEQYEYTDANGISRDEGPLIAWFKDPSGNIISFIEEEVGIEKNVSDNRDLHLNH